MSVLDQLALVAAEVGAHHAPNLLWRRVCDELTGLSFEAPLPLASVEGPFETSLEGRTTLPYVLDVTYLASTNDANPETLTWEMAAQWAVDYALVSGTKIRRAHYPGVDEAWILAAEIRDDVGTLGYSWATLRRGGAIACLGVSCWAVETSGREACHRILGSILGS